MPPAAQAGPRGARDAAAGTIVTPHHISRRLRLQVLVTNAVSVDQWTYQFKLWTTIQDENLGRFTSSCKQWFQADAGVMVCTYSMIAGSFKRSVESQRIFDAIVGREWGLILLDEVHVVPAEMFRCVPRLPFRPCVWSGPPYLERRCRVCRRQIRFRSLLAES